MAEAPSGEPTPSTTTPGRPPRWIGFVAITLLALLFSGIFTTPGTHGIADNEGVDPAQTDRVDKAMMSRKLGLPTRTRTLGSPLLGTTQEEQLCSEDTAREIDEAVRARLTELHESAKHVLVKQRGALSAAAVALLARETLSGEEVAQIGAAPPPRAAASNTA